MTYAKLTNGRIQYAPKTITYGGRHYNPTPDAIAVELGYKPITNTPIPEPEEGYMWVSGWEETEEAIVQVWHKEIAPEPEPDSADIAEQVLDILKGVTV